MPIAPPIYFTKESIIKNKFDAPEALAEQAVHCLELVAQLSEEGLSFQFKGGNSLLLILDKPQRFSIDVDIATNEPRERIESCLDALVRKRGVFNKWTKRRHATKPWLPLASYFCFYSSHFVGADDACIMLDAQLSRSPYATRFTLVHCGRLYQSDTKAEIPLASSIIGDKLLTLGPSTLGIPVGKGKEAQRLKHVFDVSLLLTTNPLLHEIRRSLLSCVQHENKLQEKKLTLSQVLTDTLAFCASCGQYSIIPEIRDAMSPVLVENIRGLSPFAGHLFSKKYTWTALKLDLARVAFVMTAACNAGIEDIKFAGALKANDDDEELYWRNVEEWI